MEMDKESESIIKNDSEWSRRMSNLKCFVILCANLQFLASNCLPSCGRRGARLASSRPSMRCLNSLQNQAIDLSNGTATVLIWSYDDGQVAAACCNNGGVCTVMQSCMVPWFQSKCSLGAVSMHPDCHQLPDQGSGLSHPKHKDTAASQASARNPAPELPLTLVPLFGSGGRPAAPLHSLVSFWLKHFQILPNISIIALNHCIESLHLLESRSCPCSLEGMRRGTCRSGLSSKRSDSSGKRASCHKPLGNGTGKWQSVYYRHACIPSFIHPFIPLVNDSSINWFMTYTYVYVRVRICIRICMCKFVYSFIHDSFIYLFTYLFIFLFIYVCYHYCT